MYSTYAQKVQQQKRSLEKEKLAAKRKSQGSGAAPKTKTPQHLRSFNKYTRFSVGAGSGLDVIERKWDLYTTAQIWDFIVYVANLCVGVLNVRA